MLQDFLLYFLQGYSSNRVLDQSDSAESFTASPEASPVGYPPIIRLHNCATLIFLAKYLYVISSQDPYTFFVHQFTGRHWLVFGRYYFAVA
jgi:hypothetical protein